MKISPLMMRGCLALAMVAPAHALPTVTELNQALAANPEWSFNQAENALANSEADLRKSSPHEWQAGASVQQRQLAGGGQTPEWSWRLESGWRLPGKARLDNDIAAAQREQAAYRLGAGSRLLQEEALGYWLDWAEARARHALRVKQREDLEQLAAKTTSLVRSGEAAQRELVQLQAELARLRTQEQEADAQERMAEETLSHHYPALMRIADDSLPAPADSTPDDAALARMLEKQPALLATRSDVRAGDLLAERARAERRLPDPVLGVFMLSDGKPHEQALGVSVSIPLGGERRSLQQTEAERKQALARSNAAVVRKLQEHELDVLAGQSRYGRDIWRQAVVAVEQARAAAALAERAWLLGEGSLPEVSQARRLSLDAEDGELQARVRLLRAQTLLQLRDKG